MKIMKKFLPFVVGALIVLVAGVFIIKTTKKPSENDTAQTNDSEETKPTTSKANCPNTLPANTVSYCNGRFNDITVSSGTLVTFRNDSDRAVQPDSDPHPAHTDNPDLNVGFMNPGQSKTVTLTKKGTWGIHNHIRDEETAKVTVQ